MPQSISENTFSSLNSPTMSLFVFTTDVFPHSLSRCHFPRGCLMTDIFDNNFDYTLCSHLVYAFLLISGVFCGKFDERFCSQRRHSFVGTLWFNFLLKMAFSFWCWEKFWLECWKVFTLSLIASWSVDFISLSTNIRSSR